MTVSHSDQMPLRWLGFGMFLLFAALVGTGSGEEWGRFGKTTSRASDPKQFWLAIAIQYLAAAGMIGYFVYKFPGYPN